MGQQESTADASHVASHASSRKLLYCCGNFSSILSYTSETEDAESIDLSSVDGGCTNNNAMTSLVMPSSGLRHLVIGGHSGTFSGGYSPIHPPPAGLIAIVDVQERRVVSALAGKCSPVNAVASVVVGENSSPLVLAGGYRSSGVTVLNAESGDRVSFWGGDECPLFSVYSLLAVPQWGESDVFAGGYCTQPLPPPPASGAAVGDGMLLAPPRAPPSRYAPAGQGDLCWIKVDPSGTVRLLQHFRPTFHSDSVFSLAVAPERRMLFSSGGKTVGIWHLDDAAAEEVGGKQSPSLEFSDDCHALHFCESTHLLSVSTGRARQEHSLVHVWDIRNTSQTVRMIEVGSEYSSRMVEVRENVVVGAGGGKLVQVNVGTGKVVVGAELQAGQKAKGIVVL